MTVDEIKRKAIKTARKVTREDLDEAINFYKETTAEEMFEALGYEKQEKNNSSRIVYIRRITEKEHFIKNQIIEVIIQFWQGSILCYEKIYEKKKIIEHSTITFVNTQVLKAINQQCKELG